MCRPTPVLIVVLEEIETEEGDAMGDGSWGDGSSFRGGLDGAGTVCEEEDLELASLVDVLRVRVGLLIGDSVETLPSPSGSIDDEDEDFWPIITALSSKCANRRADRLMRNREGCNLSCSEPQHGYKECVLIAVGWAGVMLSRWPQRCPVLVCWPGGRSE